MIPIWIIDQKPKKRSRTVQERPVLQLPVHGTEMSRELEGDDREGKGHDEGKERSSSVVDFYL